MAKKSCRDYYCAHHGCIMIRREVYFQILTKINLNSQSNIVSIIKSTSMDYDHMHLLTYKLRSIEPVCI